MAPDVKWEFINLLASAADLQDEDLIEKALDEIRVVSPADYQGDLEKCYALIKSSQKAIQYREQGIEELIQGNDELVGVKDSEINFLKIKLDDQQVAGIGTGEKRDTEYYRMENQRLLEGIKLLHEEMDDLKRENETLLQQQQQCEQETMEHRKNNNALKTDIKTLNDQIRDYQDVLRQQTDKRLSVQGDVATESKEKLKKKNQQISDLITQLTDVETNMGVLEEKNTKMAREMEKGKSELDNMVDEYERMKTEILKSDEGYEEVLTENRNLKTQNGQLTEKIAKKAADDETLADALNSKVLEWKDKMKERDDVIMDQTRELASLRDKVQTLTSAMNRAGGSSSISVTNFMPDIAIKKMEDKDKQIKQLQEELQEATSELINHTQAVENMKYDVTGDFAAVKLRQQVKILEDEIADFEEKLKDVMAKRQSAEEDARESDGKLSEALKRVALLESGQYGLTEAIIEIKDYKSSNNQKDIQIQRLTQAHNKLDDKLNDVLEENEDFRERLGLDPRRLDDLDPNNNDRFLRQQQFRIENQILLKEIEKLEEERIEMKQEIRRMAQTVSQRAASDGLTSEDLEIIDDIVEKLKENREKASLYPSGGAPNWKPPDVTALIIQRTQKEVTHLKEKKRKLTDENEGLRQAMNDILIQAKKSSPGGVSDLSSLNQLIELLSMRPAYEDGDRRPTPSARRHHNVTYEDDVEYRQRWQRQASVKVKQENEMLRAALLDVFAELQKVQNSRDLDEALQIPAVLRFSKILHKRYTPERPKDLLQENKKIKVALAGLYTSLRNTDKLPTLDEALRLPSVIQLINTVEEREAIRVDPVREAFTTAINEIKWLTPVPSAAEVNQLPAVIKLYEVLEQEPLKDDITGENEQIKSSMTEILNYLQCCEDVPDIEDVLQLPQVMKLTQLLEESEFEGGSVDSGDHQQTLRHAMLDILTEINNSQQQVPNDQLLRLPTVGKLFKYSRAVELREAMYEILRHLRDVDETPTMEAIYKLPQVNRLFHRCSKRQKLMNCENRKLRDAMTEVLTMIEQSRDNPDLAQLPVMHDFLKERLVSSTREKRIKEAMGNLLATLQSVDASSAQADQLNTKLMGLPLIQNLFAHDEYSDHDDPQYRLLQPSSSAHIRYGQSSGEVTGSIKELRHQLQLVTNERLRLEKENYKQSQQILKLESELANFDAAFKQRTRQLAVVALPKSRDFASDDVINALNEQLIMTLNDASKNDVNSKKLQTSLEDCKRQLDVLRHQMYLVYDEHVSEKERFSKESHASAQDNHKLKDRIEDLQIKSEQFDQMVDSLQSDPDTRKQKLANISRTVALLRVNEQALIRHNKAAEASEESLRNENFKLKKEMGEIEKAVVERIGYLERHKSVAVHKIAILQKALERSVSESDLELLNRRFHELTSKYRSLLQKENDSQSKSLYIEELQEEAKLLKDEAETLKSELQIEKEKRILLEETTELLPMPKGGFPQSSGMKKLAVLEMKELNERQRADHSTRMYHKLKSSIDDLQDRNKTLEEKFAQLTKLNLAAQQIERELRDELASVVPKQIMEQEREKLANIEHQLVKYKVKMSQLEETCEIATTQLKCVQQQQDGREREMKSLRHQIRTFQCKSDDNAIIGKLHREILVLQEAEADSLRKVADLQQNMEKLRNKTALLETEIDGSENALYLSRSEATNKCRQLRKTIEGLRRQFSGSIPLAQLEKFTNAMHRLRDDKARVYDELRKVKAAREIVEEKLAQAQVERESLQEMKETLKANKQADKLQEWCRKMDKLRLTDLKLQRQVVRQGEQLKYFENLNLKHDKTISSLEEDIVILLQAQESHQIEWESREAELERMLDELQKKQHQVNKRALRMDDLTTTLPDPTLPKEIQLTAAVETIKLQSKSIQAIKVKIRMCEDETERLRDERFQLQSQVMSRDRVINELRLKLPYTVPSSDLAPPPSDLKHEQMEMAREQLDSLNERLKLKEENLMKTMKELQQFKLAYEQLKDKHEIEIDQFERKVEEIRNDANRTINNNRIANTPVPGPPQRKNFSETKDRRMIELEDFVKEQDAAISSLMERIRNANSEIIKLKNESAAPTTRLPPVGQFPPVSKGQTSSEDKENYMIEKQQSEKLIHAIRHKLAKKHRRVQQLEQEVVGLREELATKEPTNEKPPSALLKKLVTKLKCQLIEKEKQLQAMNRALAELRADLVGQAQENIRAANAEKADLALSKDLVEKKTKLLKEHVERLKDENAKLEVQLKRVKQTEANLHIELKKTLHEAEEKTLDNKRLRAQLKSASKKSKTSAPMPSSGRNFTDSSEDELEPVRLVATGGSEETAVEDAIEAQQSNSTTFQPAPPPSSARSGGQRPYSRKTIYSDSREQVRELKKENEKLKQQTEELRTQANQMQQPDKNAIEVVKWETKKLFQGKIDNLKSKLQEKDGKLNALDKQVNSLRETIRRLEKQRHKSKAATATDTGKEEYLVENKFTTVDQQEQFERRINQLQEENRILREQNLLPNDHSALSELEDQNLLLQKKLQALYNRHKQQGGGEVSSSGEMKDLEDRLFRMTSDYTQLKHEFEQLKRDLPLYKDRIEEQERLVEVLKREKRGESPIKPQTSQHSMMQKPTPKQVTSANAQKQIHELEARVKMLKNVVERVERENEQLRKAPGVVSNQTVEKLKTENQQLKNRVNEIANQVGGRLSGRYESKVKSMEKVIQENHTLRKELDREKYAFERMKDGRSKLQISKDRIVKELEETKRKLTAAEKKIPKISGVGHKGYQSAITAKMLENKMKKMEKELENKEHQLANMSTKAEDNLQGYHEIEEENNKLKEQIEILERFPPGVGDCDPDLVKELQLCRLSVARLENEKNELNHVVEILKRKIDPQPEEESEEDITNKQQRETETQAEIIGLQTQVTMQQDENAKLKTEISRLRHDLRHFNEEFFEEIEDLKYNFTESVKKNLLYENQLRNFSKQFGFPVDLPPSDEE